MAQQVAVAVIVALAALYAGGRLLPARWRRALAARLGLRPGAARGGCHACDDCSGCATPVNSGKNRQTPAPVLGSKLSKE